MNFKGITLAVLSFVLVAVSCSVENDAYMNDVNKEMASVSDADVLLTAKVSLNVVATKSSDLAGTEDADAIHNCLVFLLNAQDKVVGVTFTDNYTNTWEPKFMTKVQDGLHILAIANVNIDNFLGCSSLAEIQKQVLNDASSLPKQGGADVEFGDFEGSKTTTDVPTFTLSNPIVLKQIAARVELKSFQVNYVGGDQATEKPAVQLTSVELINAKTNAYLFGEYSVCNENHISLLNGTMEPASGYSNIGAWVFQNQSSAPTKLRINFAVGGVERSDYYREYVINPDGAKTTGHTQILPGYIYRLNVTINVDKKVPAFDLNINWQVVNMETINVNVADFD